MGTIVAAMGCHEAACPVDPCTCTQTFFTVAVDFLTPDDGDVREGIRRARTAVFEAARVVQDQIYRSDR